jgi:hypothetical protein
MLMQEIEDNVPFVFFKKATSSFLNLFLCLSLLLGIAVRFWQVFIFQLPSNWMYSDAYRHWLNAVRFFDPPPFGAANPFFYQAFLVFSRIVSNESIWGLASINFLLSVSFVFFWYLFASEILSSIRLKLFYANVICWLPTFSFLFCYFLTETLLLPLLGAAFWLTFKTFRTRKQTDAILASLLWLCCLLTRAVTLPLVLICLPVIWQKVERKISGIIAVVVLFGFGLLASAKHSYPNFHSFNPLGHDAKIVSIYLYSAARKNTVTFPHTNSYIYFESPSFQHNLLHPFAFWKSKRVGEFAYSVDPNEHGKDLDSILHRQKEKNRNLLPELYWENVVFLLLGQSWPDAAIDGPWHFQLRFWERWIWAPIILSSFFCCLFTLLVRRKIYFFPLVTIFFTMALFSSVFLTVLEGRYRKPLEPLSVLSLIWLYEQRKKVER